MNCLAATRLPLGERETGMYFLLLGLVLLAMKYLAIGPVAELSWVWVLAPFGLAIVWWQWADASGFTKRRAMERENARKQERIDASRELIGTLPKGRKRK